ncbi:MAG TPA: hypothetical protein VE971_00470 [Candidatus Eisenbacteria bacterium]|nr:hypothetical protein [Candidatus Eisenbacteria bacterium]
MKYRIVIEMENVVTDIYETDNPRTMWKILSQWKRKLDDYVDCKITVESRKKENKSEDNH